MRRLKSLEFSRSASWPFKGTRPNPGEGSSWPTAILKDFQRAPNLEMLVPERRMARQWLSPEALKVFATVFKDIEAR
jgi:hypothetical protein